MFLMIFKVGRYEYGFCHMNIGMKLRVQMKSYLRVQSDHFRPHYKQQKENSYSTHNSSSSEKESFQDHITNNKKKTVIPHTTVVYQKRNTFKMFRSATLTIRFS